MSTDQETSDHDDPEEKTFKQRCEDIANDSEISEEVRNVARGLLADIEAGDLDAN